MSDNVPTPRARGFHGCLDDLRAKDYLDLADSAELVEVLLTTSKAMVTRHFPTIMEGSADQAQVALGVLQHIIGFAQPSDPGPGLGPMDGSGDDGDQGDGGHAGGR